MSGIRVGKAMVIGLIALLVFNTSYAEMEEQTEMSQDSILDCPQ